MYDAANKSNLLKNCDILIHLILEKQERIGFQPNKRNLPSHYGSTGVGWSSMGLHRMSDPVLSLLGVGECYACFIPRNALV